MVEAGRWAGVREAKKITTSTSTAAAVKKKLMVSKQRPENKEEKERNRKQSRQCTEPPESPSYRLALKSLFSCRNSHGQPSRSRAPDTGAGISSSRSKKLVCSAPSICKLKDDSDRAAAPAQMMKEETIGTGEACERRASVSGSSSSERCVKKPLSLSLPLSEVNSSKQQLQRGGSSLSSSSSSGGSSFRAGMQLRRLSGCYECHMVVDPVSGGSSSTRATATTICPCPDCGEIFVRQESLYLHQSIRHAVSELGAEDTSRNIIDIIFQSSWLKKQSPVCKVERILKVHNTGRTLGRFEEYRDAVKARAKQSSSNHKHPRCTADGNELLRFHCATLACSLGLNGATHLCHAAACAACAIIRDGFTSADHGGGGVLTMATSGRAHDALVPVPVPEELEQQRQQRRAMLVCRVIAGRVKRPKEQEEEEEGSSSSAGEYESVAGSAGVYSNLEELHVFNPRAILPCFVVVYKAS